MQIGGLAKGTIERIGGEAIIRLQVEGHDPQRSTSSLRDINAAVDFIARWAASPESGIEEIKSIADIQAVGHRVVHGGERFKQSVLITDEVVRAVEDCIDLAPLHNPANLTGISATRKLFGAGLPQVAVFDTAFHQTLPDHAFLTLCRISYTGGTDCVAMVFTAPLIVMSLTVIEHSQHRARGNEHNHPPLGQRLFCDGDQCR